MVKINDSLGNVTFSCPKCGKGKVERTMRARALGTKYTCPECGFEGPN